LSSTTTAVTGTTTTTTTTTSTTTAPTTVQTSFSCYECSGLNEQQCTTTTSNCPTCMIYRNDNDPGKNILNRKFIISISPFKLNLIDVVVGGHVEHQIK
jgi:hypothetical protein